MTAAAKPPGSDERLGTILESLELTPTQKEMLRQRWLDQVGWTSRKARTARTRYLWMRLPVVIGGVAIPGLITILLSSGTAATVPWLLNVSVEWIRLITFTVSLGVAGLAAADEVLSYGDQWRHYRRTAELLKTLGWQYLMLSGAFSRFASHADGFSAFAERVEDVLNEDVEGYLGSIAVAGDGRGRHEVVV